MFRIIYLFFIMIILFNLSFVNAVNMNDPCDFSSTPYFGKCSEDEFELIFCAESNFWEDSPAGDCLGSCIEYNTHSAGCDFDGDSFVGIIYEGLEAFIPSDCNDTNPLINPNATEIIGDGIDNDCNVSTLDFCVESLVNTSWSVWENVTSCNLSGELTQSRSLVEYDENSCGTFTNVTYYQNQTISCDYCVSDCSCASLTCIGSTCSDGCGGTCGGTKYCGSGGGGGGNSYTCPKYVPLTFENCNLNLNAGIFFVETFIDNRGCKLDSCISLGYTPSFICEDWISCLNYPGFDKPKNEVVDNAYFIYSSNDIFNYFNQNFFLNIFFQSQEQLINSKDYFGQEVRRCFSFNCFGSLNCELSLDGLIYYNKILDKSFPIVSKDCFGSCINGACGCFPDWKCDWSSCLNDEEFSYAYNCFDLNFCNSFLNKPIRKVCENFSDEVVCGNWSSCSYDVDLNYLIYTGDLTSAFKRRECFNSTSSWFEKQVCFFGERTIERCDNCSEDVFIIKDINGDVVGEFGFDEEGLLDIYFKKEKRYSNHCYNLILDGDETGIDCGGSCKDCLSLFSISFFSCKCCLFFWILFLLVLILLERFIYYSEGLRFFGVVKGIIFLWEMTFKKFFDWLFYHDVSSQQDFSKIKVFYFEKNFKKK